MRTSLLDQLRCPYCGGAFEVAGRAVIDGESIDYGVLACACCAYPIVDGIPLVILADEVSAAIRAIERDDRKEALRQVLDLPAQRHALFDALRTDAAATFSRAVRALLPDGEGDYYVLRFGDPTFVVADAVTRAVAARLDVPPGTRLVDVCGGCGHLTATLSALSEAHQGVTPTLLDRSFWRLWLARRFLAPRADVICCDANAPLPLSTGCAALTVCNDAVHYVWGKRLLVSELHRVTAWAGAVVITHAHSALGDNATAGNTLTPVGYASLFERHPPATARDDELLEWALGRRAARWCDDPSDCGQADAVAIVGMPATAGRPEDRAPEFHGRDTQWVVNPLLAITTAGDRARLTIAWPSEHYAAEFAAVRRYLDEDIELPAAVLADLEALAGARPDLVARRVLLRVPPNYV
jgi:uncharacterized protein YbaR (Trm112 family)/SAM-dependent methyltransferase